MIPYGRQDITDDDIKFVTEVLRSDFITQGPTIENFENAVSKFCGSQFALASNSATSSLHIACLALGLSKGDIAWTVTNSFVASANCVLYCGANIDFLDIDSNTLNIDVEGLKNKLIEARKTNLLPKIIICVHFGGSPCDMEEIQKLSHEFGFKIIEDASHAIGATFTNSKVGACEFSDITVFSFHPVKIITTGEGGISTTNDYSLNEKMKLLRSHGITRDPILLNNKKNAPWYYEQIDLGFNYRMTDIHAALGLSQLNRLDSYIEHRLKLVNRYDKAFSINSISLQKRNSEMSSNHLYPVIFESAELKDFVYSSLISDGIGVNVHYIPIHTQPYFQKIGFKLGQYPNAEDYYTRAISIPIYGSLSFEKQDKVISSLLNAIQKYEFK